MIYICESLVFFYSCVYRKRFRPSWGVGLLQRIYIIIILILLYYAGAVRIADGHRARGVPPRWFSFCSLNRCPRWRWYFISYSINICIYIYSTESLKNWRIHIYIYFQRTRETRLHRGGGDMCRSVGLAGEYISRPGLAAWVPVVVAVV